MKILAIETSGPIGSAALLAGEEVVRESHSPAPMHHLEWLMPAITSMLADAGWAIASVEGLAVSRGPGSFTGLRIGMATASAWTRVRGIPVVGVSTLDVIAAGFQADGEVACVIQDARRGEYAGALFRRKGAPIRLTEDLIGDLGAILATAPSAGPVLFGGDALDLVWPQIQERLGPRALAVPREQWVPQARNVGRLGRALLISGIRDDPYLLLPAYTRSPVR